MGRLDGKVAIVTGSASGIGKGIAELHAQEGASVTLVDTNEEVEKIAREINDQGKGKAVALVGDISLAESIQPVFDKTLEAFGRAPR